MLSPKRAGAISSDEGDPNVGMEIGGSVGAEREMRLKIISLIPRQGKSDHGGCSKKDPNGAGDDDPQKYICVLLSMRMSCRARIPSVICPCLHKYSDHERRERLHRTDHVPK